MDNNLPGNENNTNQNSVNNDEPNEIVKNEPTDFEKQSSAQINSDSIDQYSNPQQINQIPASPTDNFQQPTQPNAYQTPPTQPNAYQTPPTQPNAYQTPPTQPNAYQTPPAQPNAYQAPPAQPINYQIPGQPNDSQVPPFQPLPNQPMMEQSQNFGDTQQIPNYGTQPPHEGMVQNEQNVTKKPMLVLSIVGLALSIFACYCVPFIGLAICIFTLFKTNSMIKNGATNPRHKTVKLLSIIGIIVGGILTIVNIVFVIIDFMNIL